MEKNNQSGDPSAAIFYGFGFGLFCLAVQLLIAPKAAGAALYGVLFAGTVEFFGGVWTIAKGETYFGTVLTTFGGWLLGYYFLMTQGMALQLYNNESVATYMFGILPPLILLTIPTFKMGKMMIIAFVSLVLLVACLGLTPIFGNASLILFAGIFAAVACFALWYFAAQATFRIFK